MENRQSSALALIYLADRFLQDQGLDPEAFVLTYGSDGATPQIVHPRWDPSWGAPSEHTIDDLGELGILRVGACADRSRSFSLTMRGREEAAALVTDQPEVPPAGTALVPRSGATPARRAGTTVARRKTAPPATAAAPLSSTELSELARAGLDIEDLAEALELSDPDEQLDLLAYKLESQRTNALSLVSH